MHSNIAISIAIWMLIFIEILAFTLLYDKSNTRGYAVFTLLNGDNRHLVKPERAI